jgi:hypothetical protein
MLAITSCLADDDSAYYTNLAIENIRKYPTVDYSTPDYTKETLLFLAQADAMAYFEDHPDFRWDDLKANNVGTLHAFKHHLMASAAGYYSNEFCLALMALSTKD